MNKYHTKKQRVLVIGPHYQKSKGGMASIIELIGNSEKLQERVQIRLFSSYIDGSTPVRFFYSVAAFFHFLLIWPRYDIFHIHIASNGSTFRKACYIQFLYIVHKKVILHLHGAGWLVFFDSLKGREKKYIKRLFERAETVVLLSRQWKEELEKRLNPRCCIIVENGVDCTKTGEQYCEWKVGRNAFLFLGRLGKRKGIYDLLDAAERLQASGADFHLYLAGDGETEQVRGYISEKGLSQTVHFEGWCDEAKKTELLKKVCWIILPSYYEGLPMSLLEGMAAGKAVITTRFGGIPDLVQEGKNGFFVDAGNIYQIEKTMRRALEMSKEEWERMSNENISEIKRKYDESLMMEKLLHVYEGK